MKRFLRPILLCALMLVVIAQMMIVTPTFAAPGGIILSYNLNAADCTIDITAQVEDAGFYAINMWDDGSFRAGALANVPAGGTFTVRFTIGGVILQGAAGIGVYLENGVGTDATTTFDSSGAVQLWTDQVGMDCAGRGLSWGASLPGGDCPNPLPSGSTLKNIPAGALAYFAPDTGSYTGFNLPPGSWYVSGYSGDFAHVWIACQASSVWVPSANVIP